MLKNPFLVYGFTDLHLIQIKQEYSMTLSKQERFTGLQVYIDALIISRGVIIIDIFLVY